MMTTKTLSLVAAPSRLAQLAAVAALGALIVFAAGHLQAAALHDAAHDMRHATGFPCH